MRSPQWSNDVAALLTNFMPGQQAGNAIADILFGKVNPAARLPLTMPNVADEEQWVCSAMRCIDIDAFLFQCVAI